MSPWLPLVLTGGYLALLTALGPLAETRPRLQRVAQSPYTHGLALGVYATSWTFYGSVGFADRDGFAFLAISLGPTLACLAIPILWTPLARLVRQRRLASAADLLAFRYQSGWIGPFVTLFLLAGLLPYLGLQLRATADAAGFLAGASAPPWLGLAYAALLGAFAALVGVRYADSRTSQPGLLATLALESVVKLVAITAVGIGAVVGFGADRLDQHLRQHPEIMRALWGGIDNGPWAALLVASFFAMFLLPRQFHIAFVARPPGRSLRHVIWLLPAFLLVLNLPLPVLYIIGDAVTDGVAPDRYVLAAVSAPSLRLVAFVGGVSASSAMVLIATIALSGMVATHVVVPLRGPRGLSRARSLLLRRGVILGLVVAGFGFHGLVPAGGSLVDLGLVSFTAVLQLVPGVIGALFWSRANARGLFWGLAGGGAAWAVISLSPLLGGAAWAVPQALGFGDHDPRSAAVWLSLGINALLFVAGSLSRPPTPAEDAAAASCIAGIGASAPPVSVEALRQTLAALLGRAEAEAEVARALRALDLGDDEARPLALRRLRDAVEHNLAELVGPLTARAAVAPSEIGQAGRRRGLGADTGTGTGTGTNAATSTGATVAAQLRFLDERSRQVAALPPLERSFEVVRRYLSGVLSELPLGLCAFDPAGEVLLWNQSLAELSGITADDAIGAPLERLPGPWAELMPALVSALLSTDPAVSEPGFIERRVDIAGRTRVLRFRAAQLDDGIVLVVEDLTERRALREQLAHRDRLASIGSLAAGVAHEIGNPLAGLLMVARNLEREPEADDAGERLGLIVDQARRIDAIVRGLLRFSRREQGATRQRCDIAEVVADAVALVELGRRGHAVGFVRTGPGGALLGDRQALTQVLVNLLTNAQDATLAGSARSSDKPDAKPSDTSGAESGAESGAGPGAESGAGPGAESGAESGDETLQVAIRTKVDASAVEVEIEDRGPGIAPEHAAYVFEPFFTTKEPGQGTGLGLSVSYGIVRDHGGELSFTAAPGGGTIFRIRLPQEQGDPS